MENNQQFITRLVAISGRLEQRETLTEGLAALAELTAGVLGTDRCSVMLLEDLDGSGQPALRIYAHFGPMPKAALSQSIPADQGVAGHVVTTGRPLVIEDIRESAFAGQARGGGTRGLVSVPVAAGDKVVGVININSPSDGRQFDQGDAELLEVFAVFVGKSIHIVQLQKTLQSRFVQLAMQREAQERGQQAAAGNIPDPARLAKIVAKTIYRELNAGGFTANQIIGVTSEVINQLQENLEKHRRRRAREDQDDRTRA